MKALISGINGFIGGDLAKRLKGLGYEVIGIDRKLLLQPRNLKKFVLKHNPDYIFHLAAYGNHYFQTNEVQTFKTNLVGTFNLLHASLDVSYKGFINFSTTSHNHEGGSFYGATKAGGEYLVKAFVKKYNKPIVNVRPYSVFGEREWDFRFIPTICRQIKEGEAITVSKVKHDWIYIQDFIDGVLKVIGLTQSHQGQSFGIGTGKRILNTDISTKLQQLVGKKVKVNIGTKRDYEIPFYQQKLTTNTKNEVSIIEKTKLEEALINVYQSPNERLTR